MKNEEELENPGLTFVNQLVNIDAVDPNEWSQFAIPLVRRVYPQLMANKLVSPIPVKKNKQPYSLNPGKNYKRKNKR